MRKAMAMLAVLAFALCAGGCMSSNVEVYEYAQRCIGIGEYEAAAEMFMQLGEYRDSAEYALYASALQALQEGDTALARTNFELVSHFKSSGWYLYILDAMELEQQGDLEGAMEIYAGLGSFAGSDKRAAKLAEEISARMLEMCRALMAEGKWQQAMEQLTAMEDNDTAEALAEQCAEALVRQAYNEAMALYDAAKYGDALAAFESLGDTLDSPAKAAQCKSALYRAALETRQSIATAEELMATFSLLGDYLDSAERLSMLHARYDGVLALMENVQELPYIALGSYPALETGEESAVLWRVVDIEDGIASLLSVHVLDAATAPEAAVLPIAWTDDEKAAMRLVTVPDAAFVERIPQEFRAASATAYARTQGVRCTEEGQAWWWLRDSAGEGRNAIVWYTGSTLQGGVDAGETCVGVRLLAYADLNALEIDRGDGSAENPYRLVE